MPDCFHVGQQVIFLGDIMKKLKLQVCQKELDVYIANNFPDRLRGLMLRDKSFLPMGTGLLLAPCSSIHMMFMRFAIDVVYIDKEYHVLKCVKNVRPWLGLSVCWQKQTWATLELPQGTIEQYGIYKGMKLILRAI